MEKRRTRKKPAKVETKPVARKSPPKPKVFWTDQEQEQVIRATIEARRGDGIAPISEILEQAIREVLPEDRSRSAASAMISRTFREALKEGFRLDELNIMEALSRPDQVVVQAAPEEKIVEVERSTEEVLGEMTAGEILGAGIDRILGELRQGSRSEKEEVKEPEIPPRAYIPSFPPPEKSSGNGTGTPIRVLICGMSSGQIRHIKEKVDDRVKILWVDSDKAPGPFPECDHVLIQRRTQHNWWNHFKERMNYSRMHWIAGSQSEILKKIRDIVEYTLVLTN